MLKQRPKGAGRSGRERALLRGRLMVSVRSGCLAAIAAVLVSREAGAQLPEQPARPDETELAREDEDPLSKLTSVPFQNEADFGIGPHNLVRNTLSIQPTIALSVTDNLSLVSRTKVPIVSRPDVLHGTGYVTGLGDTTESIFLVPRSTSGVLWGVGPSILLPTASANELGLGQLGLGPSVAVLMQPSALTFGILATQLWSVAGGSDRSAVNQLSAMYFASFRFPSGWYLKTAPIVTADWNAVLRNMWTVPVGGGGGKILNVGTVPVDVSVDAYWNAIRPDTLGSPAGSAQVQVALLFPR